jgi:hypothetical protein
VGVRDIVAELRAFAAKITFLCHDESAPILSRRRFPEAASLSTKSLKTMPGRMVRGAPGLPTATV